MEFFIFLIIVAAVILECEYKRVYNNKTKES